MNIMNKKNYFFLLDDDERGMKDYQKRKIFGNLSEKLRLDTKSLKSPLFFEIIQYEDLIFCFTFWLFWPISPKSIFYLQK